MNITLLVAALASLAMAAPAVNSAPSVEARAFVEARDQGPCQSDERSGSYWCSNDLSRGPYLATCDSSHRVQVGLLEHLRTSVRPCELTLRVGHCLVQLPDDWWQRILRLSLHD